jgi:hypothetical protein
MDSTFRKVALVAATLGLLLSLFIALRPDDEEAATPATTAAETVAPPTLEEAPPATTGASTTTAPATTAPPEPAVDTIRVNVVGGRPQGGVQRQTVELGREVVIVVRADVSDHIHLHGYDLMADVAPGAPARLRFTADVPGRFEIELEDSGVHIANLQVRP